MNRRAFLTGMLCAPAIVRAPSLMPISPMPAPTLEIFRPRLWFAGTAETFSLEQLLTLKRIARNNEPQPIMIDGKPWWTFTPNQDT